MSTKPKRPLILVNMNNTDKSIRAAAMAAGMALRWGSDLLCLYVKSYSALVAGAPDLDIIIRESSQKVSKEIQETIQDISDSLGISIEYLEREGSPYKEIIKVATERKVDHIFVGASGRSGYRAKGSLAYQLVLRASCPITVVP